MATFTAIKNRGGGIGALGGVLRYVQQEEKTTWKGRQLVSGWNCTAQSVCSEMQLTKERFHKTDGRQYLWTYASVKNVLTEEAYTGVLINHRSETQDGKVKRLEQTEWYRHENFFPVIVELDVWKLVHQRLKEQARPANGNRSKHRYAGLLRCQKCGNVFVPMIRYWNGKRRVEYVCKGYHRNGKSYCSSHRIHEEVLDAAVQEFVQTMQIRMAKEQEELKQKLKMWALREPVLDAHILLLQKRIQELEQEIDRIVMEKMSVSIPVRSISPRFPSEK